MHCASFACSPAAELSDHAQQVLEARYLLRDAAQQVVETPAELFARVAGAVAGAESLFGSGEEARWRKIVVENKITPN